MITKLLSALRPNAQMGLKQNVKVTVLDAAGNVKRVIKSKNRTCLVGRGNMISRLGAYTTSGTDYTGVARYMAIGTSNTAPADGNTQLVAEALRSPILANETLISGTTTIKLYARFEVGQAVSIKEAGLFLGNAALSAANSGALLARTLFAFTIEKTAEEAIIVEWELSLDDA